MVPRILLRVFIFMVELGMGKSFCMNLFHIPHCYLHCYYCILLTILSSTLAGSMMCEKHERQTKVIFKINQSSRNILKGVKQRWPKLKMAKTIWNLSSQGAFITNKTHGCTKVETVFAKGAFIAKIITPCEQWLWFYFIEQCLPLKEFFLKGGMTPMNITDTK